MRVVEAPVTVGDEDSLHGSRTTHPAFAQISACRVSGNTALYDSDFRHNHYMTITIKRSEMRRNLNRDWHFGREELIEVALSESQWATFVSSLNMGDGVPCTLQRLDREMIPGLPDPESRTEQFKDEMQKDLEKVIGKVKGTIARIDEMGLPKGKAATLKQTFESVLQDLQSNMPFVAKQFDKHMEGTVEAAKQEVHGYMTGVLQRAGLEAISANMPLQIDHKGDE